MSRHLQILSVEDEIIVAERIERLSRKILGPRLQLFKTVGHIDDAFEEAESGVYDVILLDLNLSGCDGFELLKKSTTYSSQTIIISANKDRAIEAFDFGVIDFVGKPFGEDRLKQAFDRLDGKDDLKPPMQFMGFRTAGRTDVRDIGDVVYIEGADKYSHVHFKNGDIRLHDKPLAQLERLLPPAFIRIHKSYIVRFDAIGSLESKEGSRYFARLKDGKALPVSRTRFKDLRARFG